MTLDTSGRLGLGTSSPGSLLTVQANTTSYGIGGIKIQTAGSNESFFAFGVSSSLGAAYITSSENGTGANLPIYFNTGSGSTTAMCIDTSQRVGIGTTTPQGIFDVQSSAAVNAYMTSTGGNTNLRLVSQDGGQSALVFGDASDAFTGGIRFDHSDESLQLLGYNYGERLRIDSSGRLLVGTSTARQTGGGFTAQSQIEGATTVSASSLTITSNRSADDLGPRLNFARSKGGAIGSNTIVDADAEYGGIYFFGADGSDTDSIGAQISAYVDGTPGANDMPGRLVFSTTADGASSPTERMRIKANGVINFSSCPTYADDAAAGTGGLVAGDIYKTSTGELRIKL